MCWSRSGGMSCNASAARNCSCSPKVVVVDDERFLGRLARFVDDGDAALLAEGRIGQDDL